VSIGDRPTQDEVDSVASFAEAVAELEREPFFSPDDPRKLVSVGDKFTYHLGDRFHFRSALITFRRIWMKGDAENFEHVCNIIWKYTTPPPNGFLQFIREEVREETNKLIEWPKPLGVTGRELIDLWLNAVFAHSGLSGGVKLRHRFDELLNRFGNGPLEFSFRHLVWAIGIHYKNVVKLAINLANVWREAFDMKPSFRPGSPFGTKRRERTHDGELILRESSSEYFSEETYEQRFSRILGRLEFGSLQSLLKNLQFTDRELVRFVVKHDSYAAIVNESAFELRVVQKAPADPESIKGLQFFGGVIDQTTGKTSNLIASETEIVTDATGLAILDAQLRSFRHELIES
jgi:hypothetical protein